MHDTQNTVEIPIRINEDTHKTLLVYQKLTGKPMDKIVYEHVRNGAKIIKAQLNGIPHTNMNKIVDALGLSD